MKLNDEAESEGRPVTNCLFDREREDEIRAKLTWVEIEG